MGKKRICYIGASSPCAFDYTNEASKTMNDLKTYSSPNPFYIGGFGMMLLYDELWFLCESLCPENMRKLNYVKFVDQEFPLIDFKEIHNQALSSFLQLPSDRTLLTDYLSYNAAKSYMDAQNYIWQSVKDIRQVLNSQLSMETHPILIQGLRLYINSYSPSIFNYLFDMLVIDCLYERTGISMEFLAREDVSIFIEDIFSVKMQSITEQAKAIELLSIRNIPDYVVVKGPYHPCIEDIRAMPTLCDFRSKISSFSSLSDADQIVNSLNQEFIALRTELFKRVLSPEHPLKYFLHTICFAETDKVIPFFSLITGTIAEIKIYSTAKKRGWAKFMLDTGFTGE